MGSRLLRSNIVQPLTDIYTINARLDLIEELLNDEKLMFDILELLPWLDLDKLLLQSQLVQQPKKPSTKSSQLLLKNIVSFFFSINIYYI